MVELGCVARLVRGVMSWAQLKPVGWRGNRQVQNLQGCRVVSADEEGSDGIGCDIKIETILEFGLEQIELKGRLT